MKFIRDIHEPCRAEGRPAISFEFFPPKTDEGDRNLFEKTIPGAARDPPGLLLGHLRRRRQHARQDARHRGPHPARARADGDDASDVREFDARAIAATWSRRRAGAASAICSPCAAIRRTAAICQKTEGGFEFSRELVAFIREHRRVLHRHGGLSRRPHRVQGRQARGLGLPARKDRGRRGLRHHAALFRQRGLLRDSTIT